jgi:peptidyl-prolyl cis-trans isomerase C
MSITVNGEKITEADIQHESERMKQYYYQYVKANKSEGTEDELSQWAAENIVEQLLLKQKALETIEPPSPELLATEFEKVKAQLGDTSEEEAKKQLAAHLLVETLIKTITQNVQPPTEEEVTSFYTDNKPMFKMPEQVHASHIVKHVSGPPDAIKANEEIQKVKQQLDQGTPFEELATAHSDCPDSAGDLGFFPRGHMVPEFENVVFNMKPGDVSDIFATKFGYHIAKVHEKRPPGTASLHEVTEYITNDITRSRGQKLLEKYVDELKSKAEIIRPEKN